MREDVITLSIVGTVGGGSLEGKELMREREAYREGMLGEGSLLGEVDLDNLPEPKMAAEKSLLAAVMKG